MTNEKRILIAPRDILSMGFECPHCSATFFVPIDKVDSLVRQCPNCREFWATDASVHGSDYSDLKVLSFFVEFLKDIRSRQFGAAIRFEISDTKPDTK